MAIATTAFVAGDDYSGYGIYSMVDDAIVASYLPRTFRVSNHCAIRVGTDVYFSGYYGAPVQKWDTTLPWDNKIDDTYNPNVAAEPTNPISIGSLKEFTGCNTAHEACLGNDGIVYFACSKSRDGLGGGIGTLDPTTDILGGFDAGIGDHALHACATAGDYVAFLSSTNGSQTEKGSLLRYNTVTHELEPLYVLDAGEMDAGHKIVAMDKNQPVVIIHHRFSDTKSAITKLDISTAIPTVLFRREYDVALWASGPGDMVVGEDGFIYMQFNWGFFVRVNPDSGYVESIASTDSQGAMMLFGDDIYLSYKSYFRKITDYKVKYQPLVSAPVE